MNRNRLILFSALVAAGTLVGCDLDESTVSCDTDADCNGFVCDKAADAEEGAAGVCSATVCSVAGFVVNEEGACAAPAAAACTSDADCAPYACAPSGACYDACEDAAQCAEGDYQCDDTADAGQCVEVAAEPYLYVAVVSRAAGSDALDNPNPGPDIDAIAISAGGADSLASAVVTSAQGAEGNKENTRPLSTHADAVKERDTVFADAAACNLDAQPGYVAIGGDGGFIAVSFAREIADGDNIVVWEVDTTNCDEATTERPDAFDVYVGRAADANTTLESIKTTWCLVGSSGGNGGTFNKPFDASACE